MSVREGGTDRADSWDPSDLKTSLSTVNGLSTFLELIRIISKYTATTLEVVMTYDMGSVAALEFYLSDNYIFLFIRKMDLCL